MSGGSADIVFSDSTMLGYIISASVCFLLPISAFFLLRRYRAAALFPVMAGALVCFLSTRACDLSIWMLMATAPMAQKSVAAAELVGIFEETGRFLAMKYPLTNIKKTCSAVCLGIGHAGLECFIRGAQTIKIISIGRTLSQKGTGHFTAGKQADEAENVLRELRSFADNGLILSLLDSLHYFTNFGVHIALTLLIYKKLFEEDFRKRWIAVAIGLHTVHNAAGWIASLTGIPWVIKPVGILSGLAVIFIVSRLISFRDAAKAVRWPEHDTIRAEK